MDDFMQAVEWASAVWGGIFSPILPLLSDDAALDALIARWNVDVLAPVVLSPSASSLEDEALDIRVGTVSATLVQAHAALLDQIARGLGSGKHPSTLRLSYPLHQATLTIGDGVPTPAIHEHSPVPACLRLTALLAVPASLFEDFRDPIKQLGIGELRRHTLLRA
jgi:hypothetical protein